MVTDGTDAAAGPHWLYTDLAAAVVVALMSVAVVVLLAMPVSNDFFRPPVPAGWVPPGYPGSAYPAQYPAQYPYTQPPPPPVEPPASSPPPQPPALVAAPAAGGPRAGRSARTTVALGRRGCAVGCAAARVPVPVPPEVGESTAEGT